MRTIIYGDVHGCLEEFKALRKKLKLQKGDREISVGDLLDRGPLSNATLKYARENAIELVLGNHEYKYLRYYKHQQNAKLTGKKNPMSFSDDKLEIFKCMSEKDIAYLNAAPFFIKIQNLTVVHGGLTNKIKLQSASKKELESLTRIRYLDENEKTLALSDEVKGSRFWSELYDAKEGIVVYGHQPFEEVKIDKYALGIDTGCVYGNKLTALVVKDTKKPLQSYEIVELKSQKKYASKKNFFEK